MCGIIGLLVRTPELRQSLGHMLVPMFHCMGERGPDSAGLGVFGDSLASGARKVSLYAKRDGFDFTAFPPSSPCAVKDDPAPAVSFAKRANESNAFARDAASRASAS